MTNPKRKKRNRSHGRKSRRNPSLKSFFKRKSYHRRRRNPGIGGFSVEHLAKLGAGAAIGGWGTRYIAQAILGDANTGVQGYVADVAVAVALAYAAKKFAGSDVADGVAAGGISAVLLRIYSEKAGAAAPAAMSGYLGDVEFSGLGTYLQAGYTLPPNVTNQNNYLLPAAGPVGAVVGAGAPAGRFNRGI